MRTTKVIAFSVPPEFENEIQKHAKAEHRTISEYIREAVRQYMNLREFEQVRKAVTKRMKGKRSQAVRRRSDRLTPTETRLANVHG